MQRSSSAGEANGWSQHHAGQQASDPEPDNLPKADSGLPTGLPPGFTRPRKSLPGPNPETPLPNPETSLVPANSSCWAGHLAKSGKVICPIVCMDSTRHAGSPGMVSGIEPADWPQQLDVDNRIDYQSVWFSFDRAQPEQRAVQKLALRPYPPASGSVSFEAQMLHQQHRRAFVEFLNYLSGKRRAGVVQLAPSHASMDGQPRILYLIPASASVIDRFHLVWEPTELLVAVVVPK